ncbi:MAG: glutamyl-tRNA reductase [Rhodoglobus sp.]
MLLCLSSNHRNASFVLLERLSQSAADATHQLLRSHSSVTGAIILATCNRVEIYLDVTGSLAGNAAELILSSLAEASELSSDELRASVTIYEEVEVAQHLFSVTSGLESVVVGEGEIAGQVSRALDSARTEQTTSPDLERLFQRATHISRGVKNRTDLGDHDRSLVQLALELAASRITSWAEKTVLMVGTGRYAGTTITALRARGARDIRVFSPTGRAHAFAVTHGVTVSNDFAVDIVITCTASAVLGPEHFPGSHRRLVIDLGLPRNVDPAVASLRGIELLDLETIRLHAPLEELSTHRDAQAIVGAAATDFVAEAAAEPAIVALRTHVFSLLDAEIARARARGAGDETESALRHLAGVLLHGPSVRARDLASDGRVGDFVAGLDAVYGIQPETQAQIKDAESA